MKRIHGIIKPYLALAFGLLLLLYYLNFLNVGGAWLAIGIIALIFGAYYLGTGIVVALAPHRVSEKGKMIIDIVNVALFPLFLVALFITVMATNNIGNFGPTAWIVNILLLASAVALPTLYCLARLKENRLLGRLAILSAVVFALSLLLNLLFDWQGNPEQIGNIVILDVVLYALYAIMAFNALSDRWIADEPRPEEPAPADEPKPEE